MLRDRFGMRNKLNRIKNMSVEDPRFPAEFSRLADQIKKSVDLRTIRADHVPIPTIDSELPIFERQQQIGEAIRQHQVVVVSGATGSGKSTQLPLMALQNGFGISGLIGHTQPRRIAARGVASRVAQQLGSSLGTDVGFKIRFADQTSERTYVKLMTDGILLAETQSDRFLEQYDLIIVDEAHERSLNIDFLLGYLKRILAKRKELRLIITSATIDTERFAQHFATGPSTVPIIDVEGRTFPVEIQYRPLLTVGDEVSSKDQEDHIVSACRDVAGDSDGDTLVFLPTENDIRTIHKKLRASRLPGRATEILPLYARLSTAQQNQIFSPGKERRIVLATNVAESSITVPRIHYVIDSGTARISHYAPRSKVQRLPIQPISQASADQRAGRCGRIGPGICIRLYSQEDLESRPKFTTPEIRRTNLASVILQTLALKLGHVEKFPFIDPPRPESIRDGFKTLFELGAVDDHRRLTGLGRRLARLPVDPRIGRMLFAADEENCLSEVLIIAAALEIQDPRVRPAEKKKSADSAHEKFKQEGSDFISLLNIWDFFHQLKSDLSKSKLRKACEQNFLSFTLMRQWQDIHRQLRAMVIDQQLKPRKRTDDFDAIHRSLLAGLLSGIATLGERHEYLGAGGIKFHLWPGSGVFGAKPKWIMAAEIVETSRRFGRTVAKINPTWIEPLSKHLTKSRYSDPCWSKKQQSVTASEHVSLWGLPIVAGRRVNYGRIDPDVSRSIFIQEALAAGLLEANFDFLNHNQWLIQQIEAEAAKTRDRGLIVDTHSTEVFYQERLPSDIYDKVSLSQALQQLPDLDSNLRMTRADLLPNSQISDSASLYPDEVRVGSMKIPVDYRFSPGANDDGATIRLPIEAIGQLDEVQAGWLVPGFMKSQVIALIRSLPKSIRRSLVPAPETAEQVVQNIEFGKGNFIDAVARELSRCGGMPIQPSQFKLEKIDDHLKVNLQVVADSGDVIAEARSLTELRNQLGPQLSTSFVEVDDDTWHQDGLTDWTWGDLPTESTICRGATQLAAYPTIVDQQTCVGLRLSDSRTAGEAQTRRGLVRLYQILNRKSLKSQVNWLPDLDRHCLTLSRVVPLADIKPQLADLIARIGFVENQNLPGCEADFRKLQSTAAERIGIATQEVASWLPKFADRLHEVHLGLDELPERFLAAQGDIRQQLLHLTSTDFLAATEWNWLQQFPRYLQAISYRIDRLGSTDLAKDRSAMDLIRSFWERFETVSEFHATQAIVDPELGRYRWMIEEFRVSLFAQPLGTSLKVSEQRLEKQWSQVRQS